MNELTEEQLGHLERAAGQGGMIRDLCQHPGFKLYLSTLETLKKQKEQVWLQGTEEEARTARLQAQGIQMAILELYKFIKSGERANKMLDESESPKQI